MFVNRWSIVVRAKQSYVDWANSIDDDGPTTTLETARSSPTIYLVHEHDGTSLHELIDQWYWEAIFDLELVSWMRDTSTWPESRSAEMFSEWFDIELVTELVDLVKGRIKSG
jgi:hypothetical protein